MQADVVLKKEKPVQMNMGGERMGGKGVCTTLCVCVCADTSKRWNSWTKTSSGNVLGLVVLHASSCGLTPPLDRGKQRTT